MTWSEPEAALKAFVDALGGDHSGWSAYEQAVRLECADLQVPVEQAVGIPIGVFQSLVDSYGDAMRCTFHYGEDELLRMNGTIDEHQLSRFAARTRGLDDVTLMFTLDKDRLARTRYQVPTGCRAILYLYPEALGRLLRSSLSMIEDRLWGSHAGQKPVVIVPSQPMFLDGLGIAVVGGSGIQRLGEIAPIDAAEVDRLGRIRATAAEVLHWRRAWVRILTVPHLDVYGDDESGAVSAALWQQNARLLGLYTADKSTDSDHGILCSLSSPEYSVDLVVPDPAAVGSVPAEVQSGIRRVFDWVYEDPTSTKRLSIAQLVFSRHLHFVSLEERFPHLLKVCSTARDELIWTEKAVMSDALRSYAADVRSLEDYVDRTVQVFAEQVSAVVKSLTDTMLAGLGTILVGLLATIIKEGGSLVLGAALLAYGFYVAIFQVAYSLGNQEERERVIAQDFEYRRERFKERIYGESVDSIVGDRMTKARAMFDRWLERTRRIEWAVVAICILSGIAIILNALLTSAPASPPHLSQASVPSDAVPSATQVDQGSEVSQSP